MTVLRARWLVPDASTVIEGGALRLEQGRVVGAEEGGQRFILQAGSFRSAADADQMKAQLALLGAVANVQTVNVDGETWHRVRVGPVDGARAADQLRRQLQDNGIDVLVLKDSG